MVAALVGYLIYSLFAGSSGVINAPATGGPTTNAYAILKPATVPSKIAECSQPLTYQSNGNPSPVQCADGGLNILAWNALAALEPKVMGLGYTPSITQVKTDICIDGNAANQDSTTAISAPLEITAYQLAFLYYGWSFNINPGSLLTNGC